MKSLFVVLVLLASPLYAQFYLGDSVAVGTSAGDCLNARTVPSLTGNQPIKCEAVGSHGIVLAGPTAGFYQVAYRDGVTGWSMGTYLTKVVPVVPPPVVTDTSKISIQLQGFKVVQVVGDSIVIVKER